MSSKHLICDGTILLPLPLGEGWGEGSRNPRI